MGFLDALFGTKGKLKGAAPDRLFAMTTAQRHDGDRARPEEPPARRVVFQPIGTADFKQIVAETEELLKGTAEETGTKVKTHDDEYGYRWLILEDPDFDDLVVAMNTVSVQLQGGGYGDRLLAPCSPSRKRASRSTSSTTSSAAATTRSCPRRATRRATPSASCGSRPTGAELPWEEDMARWFPLWDIPL